MKCLSPGYSLLRNNPNVYVIERDVTVASGATLTIEPGTVIKSLFRSLAIEGILNAVGTVDAPIIFTSEHGDTAGGGTNDNGEATTPFEKDY